MNIGIIYIITAATSILQILLILNRTLATEFKDTIDVPFCNMLKFFSVFCLIDALWGMFVSKLFVISQLGFTVISYGFHIGAALSAFIWFGYVIYYTRAEGYEKKILNGLRSFLLAIQLFAIGSNLFTHEAFWVDELGNYSMGSLRKVLYALQFSYYFILLLYGAIKLFQNSPNTKLYRNAIIFSYVPLCFGIGQYVFYDAAMYSLGFMISGFIIYSFNVTTQREKQLKMTAKKLDEDANEDALTGLFNRRAYENALEKREKDGIEDDFVYLSMDLNGLKAINDNIGHNAGDELIKAAAEVIQKNFQQVGNVYRVGGDEFVVIANSYREEIDDLIKDLVRDMAAWEGNFSKELSISVGSVLRSEYPDFKMSELIKVSDKRMYQSKAYYYASKGIDRRGHQQALSVLSKFYEKILKLNLKTDSYIIIQMMNENEKSKENGYDEKISVWLKNFADSGFVHPEDMEEYLKYTDMNYIKTHFRESSDPICIYYRRKIDGEFKRSMLEMIPTADFSEENPIVFLYVKNIDR